MLVVVKIIGKSINEDNTRNLVPKIALSATLLRPLLPNEAILKASDILYILYMYYDERRDIR